MAALIITSCLFFVLQQKSSLIGTNFASVLGLEDFLNLEYTKIFTIVEKFLIVAFPVLSVTVFEFLISNKPLNQRYLDTSLARVSQSVGHKYADIWYFLILIVMPKLPFLTVLITLGFSRLNNSLGTSIESIYIALIGNNINRFDGLVVFSFVILLSDLAEYILHRFAHGVPIIWDCHEFHHSATEMTGASNARNVPLQAVFTFPLVIPIKAFTGILLAGFIERGQFMPLFLWVSFEGFKRIMDQLAHSSTLMLLPKPISYVFMSPSLHWLHHSTNEKHFNSNFGICFTFWDRIFGTYLGEEHLKDIPSFGVKSTEYNKYHPLISFCFVPFMKIFKRVKKSYKKKNFLSLLSYSSKTQR